MNEETKYCKFCGKEKPIKDFVKSGFCVKNICKDCNNKKQKEVYKNSKNYHKLQQENQQLKDNWNKLKQYLLNGVSSNNYIITENSMLYKMQELEKSDK